MVSLRDLLGFGESSGRERESSSGSRTVDEILSELRTMQPAEARYLAAFAYTLSRPARADLDISESETRAMEETIARFGKLDPDRARLVVRMVKERSVLFGSTEDFIVTRIFKELSTPKQREELLHCLFAISGADGVISVPEEEVIRQVAYELDFDHAAYIAIRSQYAKLREVLRDLPGKGEPDESE